MERDFVAVRYGMYGQAVEYCWGDTIKEALSKGCVGIHKNPYRNYTVFAKQNGHFHKKGRMEMDIFAGRGIVLTTPNNTYCVNDDGTITQG